MSVHHWGEDPTGDWQLNIYFSSDAGYVTMGDLAVELYGTEQVPESVLRIPEECDSECVRGCSARGREYCDSCRNQRMLTDLSCVAFCPGEEAAAAHRNSSLEEGEGEGEDSCSMGGYCLNCKQRFLHLSLPMIALLTVALLVLLVGIIAVSFVLWKKHCRHSDYVRI